MLGDDIWVELGVIDEYDYDIGCCEGLGVECDEREASVAGVHLGNVGIAELDLGAAFGELVGHRNARTFAPVAGAFLVGKAEQEHLAAVEALAFFVEQ